MQYFSSQICYTILAIASNTVDSHRGGECWKACSVRSIYTGMQTAFRYRFEWNDSFILYMTYQRAPLGEIAENLWFLDKSEVFSLLRDQIFFWTAIYLYAILFYANRLCWLRNPKETLNKSPHTSGCKFCAHLRCQNLEIHKVFLRFCRRLCPVGMVDT